MAKTPKDTGKASGLTIKRALVTKYNRPAYQFTFSWKKGSPNWNKSVTLKAWYYERNKYGALNKVSFDSNYSFTFNDAKTSATFDHVFYTADYWPYTGAMLAYVGFSVSGCASETSTIKYYESSSVEKEWDMMVPLTSKNLKAELDSTNDNLCVFSWEHDYDETNKVMFERCMWKSELKENFDKQLAPYDFSSNAETGGGKSVRSKSFTEANLDATKSYTRIFAEWPEGMAGGKFAESRSDNRARTLYAKHVYATPYPPKITKAEFGKGIGKNHTSLLFTLNSTYARPIDTVETGYLVATPLEGGECPNEEFSYKNSQVYAGATMSDEITTETAVGLDKCMWVRVKANHDRRQSWSDPVMVTNGGLTPPVLTSQAASTDTSIDIVCENNSEVTDSFIVVWVSLVSSPSRRHAVGIIPYGDTTATVTTMDLSGGYRVGLQTVAGTATPKTVSGITEYTVTPRMQSTIVWSANSTIAKPPENVSVTAISPTAARIVWDWPWVEATKAILSWADHEDAWESTNQPDEFVVEQKALAWNIYDLDANSTYWFRIKLQTEELESVWSEPVTLSLSESPAVPTLGISETAVTMDDTLYFSVGASGTGEYIYQVAEWDATNSEPLTDNLVSTRGTTELSISIADINNIYDKKSATRSYKWSAGQTHQLVARATPVGGQPSQWSEPVPVTVVPKPAISSVTTNLSSGVLTALPLTVTVAGTNILTTDVSVVRADDYEAPRPNETKIQKYEGDVVGAIRLDGTGTATFSDFNGELDDGALFDIEVSVTNGYGTDTETIRFEPHYTHQPMAPEVTAEVVEGSEVFVITPEFPSGYTSATGDVCDIYRLSLDKPELIYQNAEYGEDYVDPYPTFGENGGYIVAAKTANGDTIDEDDTPAWTYVYGGLEGHEVVRIDFNNDYVDLPYNLDLSNTWSKDFQRTEYLGGSVQGDWNPAVTRDLSVSTVGVSTIDGDDTDVRMRRLADYAGICHVRTPEGSSFAADVQVKESQGTDGRKIDWSLDIKKVDPEGYDGMTLDAWNEQNEEES